MNSINDVNGCSVCQPDKENYTTYTTKLKGKRVRMYPCCAPTLEVCRERRDKWLKKIL